MAPPPPRPTSPPRPVSAGSDKSDKSGKSGGSGVSFHTAASGNSAGSGGTTGSNSSYASAWSEDSYLAKLQKDGIEKALLEMLGNIVLIGSDELDATLLKVRKELSHDAKKLDPKNTARPKWTPEMEAEHKAYKALVVDLEEAKRVQEESTKRAMAKGNAKLPVADQERLRNTALDDDEKWVAKAIRASSGRLGFMRKHPGAFSTPSTLKHIEAAEHNLNSVKNALEERQRQREQIRKIHEVAAQKAAAAARKAAKEAGATNAGASKAAKPPAAAKAGPTKPKK